MDDSSGSASKRSTKGKELKRRSPVWNHYDLENTPEGRKAACKYCVKKFSADHGTSQPKRHLESNHRDKYPCSSETSLVDTSYDQETSRELLTQLVACGRLPLRFVENPFLVNWARSLQPMYIPDKMENLKFHVIEFFSKEKLRWMLELRKPLYIHLTFHTRDSRQHKYLVITAHHVNDSFESINVMIGFKQLPPDYTHIHLKSVAGKCFIDWNIGKKILTFTSSTHFRSNLTSAFHPRFNHVLHSPCCSEVINAMLGYCLVTIHDVIESIRRILRSLSLKYSNQELCNQDGTSKQNVLVNFIPLDDVCQWDSTLRMLHAALSYTGDLDHYAYNQLHKEYSSFYVISSENWRRVSSVVKYMQTFHSAMSVLSNCKDCQATLFLKTLWEIWDAVSDKNLACDEMLNKLSIDMQHLLRNYLASCNYQALLTASVLDPSKKMYFVEFCLQDYSEVRSDVNMKDFASFLQNLFNSYLKADRNKNANMVRESSNTEEAEISNCRKRNVQQRFSQFKKQKMNEATLSELGVYLNEAAVDADEKFNVLHWWKINSYRYPLLSRMARDFLAIKIMALPSEYAFCMNGQIVDCVDDATMSPDVVEALMCCKHWEQCSFDDDSSSQCLSNSSVLMV